LLDYLIESMTYLSVDYNWFFSTLSQSLAALIGIGCMFIIYRLQMQENNINETVRALQRYLSPIHPDKLFYMTREETTAMADGEINHHTIQIKHFKEEIAQSEEKLKRREGNESFLNGRIRSLSENIRVESLKIDSLQSRKSAIILKENYRDGIQFSAFISLAYMGFLFFGSLIALTHGNFFLKHQKLGNGFVLATLILLLGGLFLSGICCLVGLNMGRSMVKDIFIRFISRWRK